MQGRDIGVKATAYILDIKDHAVNTLEAFRGWFFCTSVERKNRNTRFLVFSVANSGASAAITPETVLRCEDLPDPDPMAEQGVHKVGIADAGRVISDYPYCLIR